MFPPVTPAHKTDKWEELQSQPRCPRREVECRICFTACPQDLVINPINVYRLWNTYYQYYAEADHLHIPWLLVKPFLEEHGYHLLTRGDLRKQPDFAYDPKLVTLGSPSSLLFEADFWEPRGFSVHTYPAFDSLGRLCFIKTVPVASPEADIWRTLSSPPLEGNPRNHTVPVINVLQLNPDFASAGLANSTEDSRLFVIMKHLQTLEVHDDKLTPHLRTSRDVALMLHQLTEGLAFLHSAGIVHNDIGAYNVVWEDTPRLGRQFYFIDFQFSQRFPPPSQSKTLLPWTDLRRPMWHRRALNDPFENEVAVFGLFFVLLRRDLKKIPQIAPEIDILGELGCAMQRTPEQGQMRLDEVQERLALWLKELGAPLRTVDRVPPGTQQALVGRGIQIRLKSWIASARSLVRSNAIGYLPLFLGCSGILCRFIK